MGYRRTCGVFFGIFGFKSGYQIGSRVREGVCALLHVLCVCVCVCVLIPIFRGAPLSIPTCVNTPADQMADNDFQIDTLHSTSRENQ